MVGENVMMDLKDLAHVFAITIGLEIHVNFALLHFKVLIAMNVNEGGLVKNAIRVTLDIQDQIAMFARKVGLPKMMCLDFYAVGVYPDILEDFVKSVKIVL